MKVINCLSCGRIFKPLINTKECPTCRSHDEKRFTLVKDYVYDNPMATIEEVVEFTEVAREYVIKYIKQGRLETVGNHMVVECENCGQLITSGDYCQACIHEMSKSFTSASSTLRRTSRGMGGMHTRKK